MSRATENEVPLWVGALTLISLAALAGVVPLVVTVLLLSWVLTTDRTGGECGDSRPLDPLS